ncbi:MAG: FAD-dependent oxidoreductase [Steroidobacteraceae bacterium]
MTGALEGRWAQAFPTLTPAQMGRLEAHGTRVQTRRGEILAERGERFSKMLVVLSGSLEVVRPTLTGELPITVHERGGFTGEISTLRGLAIVVRVRVRDAGEVLVIAADKLRAIVQADAELSELIMRAFILRRVGLIDSQQGDAVLIGSQHNADTLRLQQFLTRNGFPHMTLDIDRDSCVQALLDQFQVGVEDIPVVLCRGELVLKNPSNEKVAKCLGMNPQIDACQVRDLLVIGAGPAGLAAAVYGASEGLDVLVIETGAPGGQAGSSSRIENYLGFPTGISGGALAGRALVQAQKFGADVTVASSATRLVCDRQPYKIELSDGHALRGRAIVIASGAEYRQPAIENLSRFLGRGVYYAATHVEAQLCGGEEIIVVGGGNSAGQGAVFLASNCRHVHLLVRGPGLADSMSKYLIRRIENSPNVTLHTHTELVELEGDGRLQRTVWRSGSERQARDIGHVFLMTGAVPNTRWLAGCVQLDEKGFVRTGPDLQPDDAGSQAWPLARAPYLLETSMPSIFAVGDVRSGSVKRVASAVGEGSVSIPLVHRVLAE